MSTYSLWGYHLLQHHPACMLSIRERDWTDGVNTCFTGDCGGVIVGFYVALSVLGLRTPLTVMFLKRKAIVWPNAIIPSAGFVNAFCDECPTTGVQLVLVVRRSAPVGTFLEKNGDGVRRKKIFLYCGTSGELPILYRLYVSRLRSYVRTPRRA